MLVKKMKKAIKIFLTGLLGLIVLLVIIIGIGKIVNIQKYKIHSETGIQKAEYVTIGGMKQYIQIRGQDISNPVIIVLHGGPGSTMAYYSYYWQNYLEKNYTIVHWDQRSSGNTYYKNREKSDVATLDELLSDLDELVDFICTELDKEEVIIMGHSWGTVLGGIYAGTHPEKISHYVAVSQMVSAWEGEEKAFEEAIRLANEQGKTEIVQEIKAQFELISSSGSLDMLEFMAFRNLTGDYLPTGDNMSAINQIMMGLFSPNMTINDLRWFLLPMTNFEKYIQPNGNLHETLFANGGLSMYNYTTWYEVPVTFIMGDSDWITPYVIVEDYLINISAPQKELIYIENAGHTPFLDKPKEFSDALLKVLSD